MKLADFYKGSSTDLDLKRLDEFIQQANEAIAANEEIKRSFERGEITIAKGQMNKAQTVVESLLEQLSGDVIAELDFIDKTTFGYLDSIPKACGIKIITSAIKDERKCQISAERCAHGRPHFSIAKINKIHQRWIGSKDTFIIELGADLKTDHLGHCEHTIRKLKPEFYNQTIARFEILISKPESELKRIYGTDFTREKFYSKP